MKPRQCAKALKSKAVNKVMAALEDPICSDPKFLSGKLGVIPLLNILGKKVPARFALLFLCIRCPRNSSLMVCPCAQKMADVKVKVLEVAAKFVTADTQNAFAIIQGGLKGTAKWCGAQAVLPYLLDTEVNKDAGLTPSQVLQYTQYLDNKI